MCVCVCVCVCVCLGGGGGSIFYFWWIEKNSVKVKNSTKLDDSLKFIDVYNIIIDLDARDGILSLMNSYRFSDFESFTNYCTTQNTTYAI